MLNGERHEELSRCVYFFGCHAGRRGRHHLELLRRRILPKMRIANGILSRPPIALLYSVRRDVFKRQEPALAGDGPTERNTGADIAEPVCDAAESDVDW